MTIVKCTYPDGATSEARYSLTHQEALVVLSEAVNPSDDEFTDEEDTWDVPTLVLGGES